MSTSVSARRQQRRSITGSISFSSIKKKLIHRPGLPNTVESDYQVFQQYGNYKGIITLRDQSAIGLMNTWTWEAASSKPPCPPSPPLGPMNETLPEGEFASTGYQGLPREQCQLIHGRLSAFDCKTMEIIHRDATERALAGEPDDCSPEELFQFVLEKHHGEKKVDSSDEEEYFTANEDYNDPALVLEPSETEEKRSILQRKLSTIKRSGKLSKRWLPWKSSDKTSSKSQVVPRHDSFDLIYDPANHDSGFCNPKAEETPDLNAKFATLLRN
jgi:hypothetical protein